jgi:hypothetical protein
MDQSPTLANVAVLVNIFKTFINPDSSQVPLLDPILVCLNPVNI